MKSPCRECELENYSKDNPTCRDCDERVHYVRALDGFDASNQQPQSEKPFRAKTIISTDKLKKAELYIQQTCNKHFIDLDDLKGRRRAGNLGAVRTEIIFTLRKEFKLSMLDIGKLLGKTYQAISYVLNSKKARVQLITRDISRLIQSRDKQPKPFEGVRVVNGEQDDPQKETKEFIYISFEKQNGLYKSLAQAADNNFRTPEGQVLYFISEALKDG